VLSLTLDTKKAAINQLLSVRLTIIQNVCARVRLDRNEVVAAVSIIMFCCFFMQYYYTHSLCFQNEFCLFFLYIYKIWRYYNMDNRYINKHVAFYLSNIVLNKI